MSVVVTREEIIKKQQLSAVLLVVFSLFPIFSMAGTGGTEFNAAVATVVGWLTGGLGDLLAVGAFGVGIAMGVVRQSIMAAVVGVSVALAVFYGPGILTGIVTAAI